MSAIANINKCIEVLKQIAKDVDEYTNTGDGELLIERMMANLIDAEHAIANHNHTADDVNIILEAARIGLSDAESFDELADSMDLADEELQRIREGLAQFMSCKPLSSL